MAVFDDGQGSLQFYRFMSRKNRFTLKALPPPPYLIIAFLPPAVGDLGIRSAIYTNHINILTYRWMKF